MSLISLLLIPSGLLFLLAARAAVPGTDFRQHSARAAADRAPLLGDVEEGDEEEQEVEAEEESRLLKGQDTLVPGAAGQQDSEG